MPPEIIAQMKSYNPHLVDIIFPDPIVPRKEPNTSVYPIGENTCVSMHGVKFIFNNYAAAEKFKNRFLLLLAPYIGGRQ